MQEEELIQSENSASIFNTLSDIPSQMDDAELLLAEAMRLAGALTDMAVETQRRKHLAYLIADQGQLLGTSAPTNLSQVGPRLTYSVGSLEGAQSRRGPSPPATPCQLSTQARHGPAADHGCGEGAATRPVWVEDRPAWNRQCMPDPQSWHQRPLPVRWHE